LKATGWTDITEMQNKIEEVLNKVGMKDFGKKCRINWRRTTTGGYCTLC
jgi:hypothetical protein